MTLTREDFPAFFAAVHGGSGPFTWQERLLDAVLDKGRWPDQIVAPTGSGKTAVIDVHVFALALAASSGVLLPPRRLAMVVGRRVLVDDQFEHARRLAERLTESGPDIPAVLREVAAALWKLRTPDPTRRSALDEKESPLVVARLRGGLPPSRRWCDDPTAAAVICATPDMWGSRVLFRGYGSASRAWPREAGLLAIDSVAVVDEAHLSRQLLCTARRVAELAMVAEREPRWRPLQVVETTATPDHHRAGDSHLVALGVDDTDVEETLADSVLTARLTKPKPVELLPTVDWPPTLKGVGRIARSVADAVVTRVPDALSGEAQTVGCFVNSVPMAVAVSQELRSRRVADRPLRVATICGQIRPIDLDRIRAEHPGLLSVEGDPGIDVLVSTQSLEVGVDLDLAAVVTELASGSAIAQRAGRVNRLGRRGSGPLTVVVPASSSGDVMEPTDFTDKMRSGPYEVDDLRRCLAWLRDLAVTPEGLSPWNLRAYPPPAATTQRELYQRPELFDVWHWARTSDDLAAEPELDLWLAEAFDDETSVGLVTRKRLPLDDADAVRLVSALKPRRHEVFSVPYGTAITALQVADQYRRETSDGPRSVPMVRLRGDDVDLLSWRHDGVERKPRLRPGDVIVVDAAVEIFTAQPNDLSFSPPVVVDDRAGLAERAIADDVMEAAAALPTESWMKTYERGGVVLRIDRALSPFDESPKPFEELAGELDPQTCADDVLTRAIVCDWLRSNPRSFGVPAMVNEAANLLDLNYPQASEIVVHRDADEQVVRVLVLDRRQAKADEVLRQVWTVAAKRVTLESHESNVGARAELLAVALGLSTEITEVLREAGLHHDDGKRDARFQIKLGARPGEELLAKSRAGTTSEQRRRRENASGLPPSWRHEQRSVVECWPTIADGDVDGELIARLVGTSHGFGRAGFPHGAQELLSDPQDVLHQAAQQLFDLGEWDALLEATQRRYGVWGCAYLEAVLRAADGQVSGEGS